MSYLALDAGFVTHPKLLELTHVQRWTWLAVMSQCARHRTDGYITRIALKRLGVTPSLLERLVELRLLDIDPAQPLGEGFRVHDFEKYNGKRDPTARERKQRERERKAAAAAQDADQLREARGAQKRSQSALHQTQNDEKNATANPTVQAKTGEMSRVTSRARGYPYPDPVTTTQPEAKDPGHGRATSKLERVDAATELARLQSLAGGTDAWPDAGSSEGDDWPG